MMYRYVTYTHIYTHGHLYVYVVCVGIHSEYVCFEGAHVLV